MTSWTCLVISGLKRISNLKSHSDIFLRSSFDKFADPDESYTVENKEVSSANNLADDFKFLGRSLMHIKKSSAPSIDTWRTPASNGAH